MCIRVCAYVHTVLDQVLFVSLKKPKLSFLLPNPCLILGSLETFPDQHSICHFQLAKHYFLFPALMQSYMLDTLLEMALIRAQMCDFGGKSFCIHLYACTYIHIGLWWTQQDRCCLNVFCIVSGSKTLENGKWYLNSKVYNTCSLADAKDLTVNY